MCHEVPDLRGVGTRAREQRRARRRTHGLLAIRPVKRDALFRDAVDVRALDVLRTIGAQFGAQVVDRDEQHIRTLRRNGRASEKPHTKQHERDFFHKKENDLCLPVFESAGKSDCGPEAEREVRPPPNLLPSSEFHRQTEIDLQRHHVAVAVDVRAVRHRREARLAQLSVLQVGDVAETETRADGLPPDFLVTHE
jgi:hypothetical protein